jgi:hypothetical protein
MSAMPDAGLRDAAPARNRDQWQPFAAQADRLGHDRAALLAGSVVVSYPLVRSVEAARTLLPVTPARRRRRQAGFFGPEIALRRAIGQGVHDRLEAAVFAAGEIDLDDEAGAGRHFPFPAKATSVLRRELGPGECWDLSVRGAEFGLDDLEDLLVLVNVGELVLGPGAAVVVRGNLLALVVQRLICAPQESPAGYHLGILPTPFSVDPRRNRTRAADGREGLDGVPGRSGVQAQTRPSFLGPLLVGSPPDQIIGGEPGTDGTAGTDGAPGAAGGPSKLADITIGELVGTLVLRAEAAAGLDGGAGGQGGRGAAGGAGAAEVQALGATVRAGHGGNGGSGGPGGRGGRGGSGGISSNVFLTLPPEQVDQVRVLAVPSIGGRGGAGGRGGTGGRGGASGVSGRGGESTTSGFSTEEASPAVVGPGIGGSSGFSGESGIGRDSGGGHGGRPGPAGRDGDPGKDGRSRPAPPVFVNEDLWRNA